MVLAFIFKSLIHLGLSFVYGMRWGFKFMSVANCPNIICWQDWTNGQTCPDNSTRHWIVFVLLLEINSPYIKFHGFLYDFQFLFFDLCAYLASVPHYLDYCGFIVCFKVRQYWSSNSVLFQNYLLCSSSLKFPYKFQSQFVNFCKKKLLRYFF